MMLLFRTLVANGWKSLIANIVMRMKVMASALIKKRNSTKSIRTRQALKRVAHEIFERLGHGAVSADSVSSGAGFSHGTFYKYYPNKDALLFEICLDYLEQLASGISNAHKGNTAFDRIFSGQYQYAQLVINDWKFHRSVIAYSLENREIGDLFHEMRVKEARRTADQLMLQWQAQGGIEASFSSARAEMMALSLNGMTEGYLQDLLRPSTAAATLKRADINAIAFELTRIFYRAAFLEEPQENLLSGA
jgi:AcrR family transcriptional regulator